MFCFTENCFQWNRNRSHKLCGRAWTWDPGRFRVLIGTVTVSKMNSHSHASVIRRTGTVVSWLTRVPILLNTQFSCKAIQLDKSLKSMDGSSKTPCSLRAIDQSDHSAMSFLPTLQGTNSSPANLCDLHYLPETLCKRQFLRLMSTGRARFIAEAANGNTQLKYQQESILHQRGVHYELRFEALS